MFVQTYVVTVFRQKNSTLDIKDIESTDLIYSTRIFKIIILKLNNSILVDR